MKTTLLCILCTLAGALAGGTAYAYHATDHHRTLKVFYDYQPKVTDRVTIMPEDYFALYKVDPKNPDSAYELEVKRNGVTLLERTYPSTFRYISLSHDCNLSCLDGD